MQSPASGALGSVTSTALVALALLQLGGCDGLLGPSRTTTAADLFATRDANAAVQSDALSYTLTPTEIGYEAELAFVFTNPADAPVYIVNCNGMSSLHLEKWIDGSWIGVWGPVTDECLSPPIVVQPGAHHEITVSVFGGYPTNNFYPKFSIDEIPGAYRLVLDDVLWSFDAGSYPFGEPVPRSMRTSNPFELALPASPSD